LAAFFRSLTLLIVFSPGPMEATATIADKNTHLISQLDPDAHDAQWMVGAISWMLNRNYGRMVGRGQNGDPAE